MEQNLVKQTNLVGMKLLCNHLDVSRSTLYRTVIHQEGFPPIIKIGKHNKWDINKVDQWLEDQAIKASKGDVYDKQH